MLVLSRKVGQKTYIGKDIVITVLEIGRGKIRLGIDCPKDIHIDREERVKKEREAGNGKTDR